METTQYTNRQIDDMIQAVKDQRDFSVEKKERRIASYEALRKQLYPDHEGGKAVDNQ